MWWVSYTQNCPWSHGQLPKKEEMQDDIVHIIKVRYVRITVCQQLQQFSTQHWEPLFEFLQFPHLLKEGFQRVTDPQIREFPFCAQITRLSNPYYTREKQQQACNNVSVKCFCSKDCGSHKDGAVWERDGGHVRVDMAWNWINKWKISSLWPKRSRARERPVVMPQWGTPVKF